LPTHRALLLESVTARELLLLLLEVPIVARAIAVRRRRAIHAAAVVTVDDRCAALGCVPLLGEATAALGLFGVTVG
jgi:hypothetical protein